VQHNTRNTGAKLFGYARGTLEGLWLLVLRIVVVPLPGSQMRALGKFVKCGHGREPVVKAALTGLELPALPVGHPLALSRLVRVALGD